MVTKLRHAHNPGRPRAASPKCRCPVISAQAGSGVAGESEQNTRLSPDWEDVPTCFRTGQHAAVASGSCRSRKDRP